MKQRATAILIKDDQILLMERKKDGRHYWVFPGGGVEEGESVEYAVKREVMEETSIRVEVNQLLYKYFVENQEKEIISSGSFYTCSYVSGEPALGDANEKADLSEENFYKPQWVPLDKLPELSLYPLEVRDWILEDVENDFANTPRELHAKVEDLRK